MEWSKPFYGVQHLLDIDKNYQVTLEDHDSFVRVFCLSLKSAHPFTAVAGKEFSSVADAQKWGERFYRNNILFAGI